MNKEYALTLLSLTERGQLDPHSKLAKEAFRYLTNRKMSSVEILDRIHSARNNTRRK